jgi:6-phosphogluconolactonase
MKRIIIIIFILATTLTVFAQNQVYRLLIGTYTNTGKSEGVYSYSIDMKLALITQKSVTKGITNPSFLNISADGKFVYAVSESANGSAANAFLLDKKNEKLQFINTSLTKSKGPCYICSTPKHVFTANYGGGSITVFGIKPDGSLTDILQLIQHKGKSINSERQNEPHVHQAIMTPDNKFLLCNDLGIDKVTVYNYNSKNDKNILSPFDSLTVKLGSGPRHLTFSKNGRCIYLLQEIDGTLSVLEIKRGKLRLIQETTVDNNKDIVNRSADIHISPDGKFVYATNRGTANNITCFSTNNDGKLTFRQQISSGGVGPRNFAITPDGSYIFVANQQSNNIIIFERNKKSGILTNTGKQIEVGAPVCLLFY